MHGLRNSSGFRCPYDVAGRRSLCVYRRWYVFDEFNGVGDGDVGRPEVYGGGV